MQRSSRISDCLTVAAFLAVATTLSAQTSRSSAGYFPGGSVSGIIVDTEGIPQMGALVQLLLPDATPAATALTDSNGHYRVSNLRPGRYRVRATAALFLPSVRQTLQIGTSTRAVVNLTLATLLAPTQWLHATRRTSDAAEDDWIWTLRSSAIRPVLRIAVDDDSNSTEAATSPVSISSSSRERRSVQVQGRATVYANDGAFAHGGTHQVLSLERNAGNGSVGVLRADFSGSRTPYPVAPSAEISGGFSQQLPLGATSRTVFTYLSHPELLNAEGSNGMQAMVVRNAQRMELGDTFQVDAGSVLRAFNLAGNTMTAEPFLRVAYRPSSGVVIAYAFTAARGTSQLEDLDSIAPATPLAVRRNGKLQLSRGHANSISLAVKTPREGKLEVAAYRESMIAPLLSGIGALKTGGSNLPLLSDPSTGTFVLAGNDFNGTGVRLLAEQPLTPAITLVGSVANGTVLSNSQGGVMWSGSAGPQLTTANAVSASLRVRSHVNRTGTRMEAGYRWQRANTLTAVDSFRSVQDPAYLSLLLRQSLQRVPLLPNGLEAVVQLQNLLAEGYQPFLSGDGKTIYLAQSPRMLQAGLAFNF